MVPVLLFKAEASLEPMVQGLASGSVGSLHEVPRTSLAPSSARLRLLRGRRPWFKVSPPARSARGMRSPGPHSVSAPLRSLQNRRPPDVLQPIFRKTMVVVEQAPWVQGLRSATVVAEQTSPGRLATHLPQGFGCCGAGALY